MGSFNEGELKGDASEEEEAIDKTSQPDPPEVEEEATAKVVGDSEPKPTKVDEEDKEKGGGPKDKEQQACGENTDGQLFNKSNSGGSVNANGGQLQLVPFTYSSNEYGQRQEYGRDGSQQGRLYVPKPMPPCDWQHIKLSLPKAKPASVAGQNLSLPKTKPASVASQKSEGNVEKPAVVAQQKEETEGQKSEGNVEKPAAVAQQKEETEGNVQRKPRETAAKEGKPLKMSLQEWNARYPPSDGGRGRNHDGGGRGGYRGGHGGYHDGGGRGGYRGGRGGYHDGGGRGGYRGGRGGYHDGGGRGGYRGGRGGYHDGGGRGGNRGGRGGDHDGGGRGGGNRGGRGGDHDGGGRGGGNRGGRGGDHDGGGRGGGNRGRGRGREPQAPQLDSNAEFPELQPPKSSADFIRSGYDF